MSPAKRAFDLAASMVGLIVLSPLLLGCAVAAKLHDGGPMLFRHRRVGRGGEEFQMLKFRSMMVDADKIGGPLTVGADARITPIGRILRKSKLDELPQLFNVLAGEMSFVGPRPEVAKYVALYNADERRVLELTPGITDPASIAFAGENELLAAQPDPERYYIETIMPRKIAINLAYAENATVFSDVFTILKTFVRIFTPAADEVSPSSARERRL
jgi:lipopolysaccharide/colanic/teichoic acid biosynthesis glycosyltransferase